MAITPLKIGPYIRSLRKPDIRGLIHEFNIKGERFKLELEQNGELMRVLRVEGVRKVPFSLWKRSEAELHAWMKYKLEKEHQQQRQKRRTRRKRHAATMPNKSVKVFYPRPEPPKRKKGSGNLPKWVRDELLPKTRNVPVMPPSGRDPIEDVLRPDIKPIFYPGGSPGLGRRGRRR